MRGRIRTFSRATGNSALGALIGPLLTSWFTGAPLWETYYGSRARVTAAIYLLLGVAALAVEVIVLGDLS